MEAWENKQIPRIHETNDPVKTLRDEIAIAVLDFLIRIPVEKFQNPTVPQVCNTAYMWADAMLKAREVE